MQQATSLVIMAAAAFLLPLLSNRLRTPAVVLELLFGILIGPITGWVSGSELVDLLAELGLFLLMFLAGFEIDFRALERQGGRRLAMLLVVFLLTLAVAEWFTTHLGYDAFMTLVLATTSVGLVVPTLRSTRRTFTRLGQYILVSAIFADFLTLVLVAMLALVERHGFGIELLKMPLLFIAITFVLRALRLAVWWYPHRFTRLFSADDPEELGIRASLALMLAFVGLSIALDVEPILGAFLAGSVFALVFRDPGHLQEQLSGFSYGFLIPIFFINVGMRFELTLLEDREVLTRAGLIILIAFAVKMLPSFLFMLRGLSLRECLAAGVLLSARLSLIIAVATVGVELGLLSIEDRAIAILLAAVSATLAPTAFRALAPPLPSEARSIAGAPGTERASRATASPSV